MTILETCREYLERAYRERLGIQFSDSICQVQSGRQPVWRFVAADDLITEVEPRDGAVGTLLDPEIGLVFYLVPFQRWTDVRKQIVCALALRSRLSIEAQSANQEPRGGDPRGAWRVGVNWLVDLSDRESWIRAVSDVRRETPIAVDISLDAIFLTDQEDVESQLARHGFPRLLLTTRQVFRKDNAEDVTRWMSADDLVRRTLAGFHLRFEKPEQRELAEGVIQAMEEFTAPSVDSGMTGKPEAGAGGRRTFRRIEVENFRNLRNIVFDLGPDPVGINIVQGANGTGKSSLCEAISFALFGSSSTYKAFADRTREKDVSATDRAREYLTRYLAPLAETADARAETGPKIALNGHPLLPAQLVTPAETGEAEIAMSGTILPQDMSLEFTRMSAQELGARILRGYSGLADQVDGYVESRVLEANTNRQDFLRTFGLSASITKLETAFERIARREIDRSLPSFPRPLVDWLDTIQVGAQLSWRWQEWGNESSRNALAVRLSQMDRSPGNLESEIRGWLEELNALSALSMEVLKNVEARIGSLRQDLDQVAARIANWGEWLERRSTSGPLLQKGPSSDQAESLAKDFDRLQAEQQRVLEQGRNLARHLDHLTQVEAYVKETWGKQHPGQCPTCGADHADKGGVAAVIESLREQTTAERDRLRGEYAGLKRQIDEVQKGLAGLGQVQCPVNAAEQARLADALRWLIPAQANFSEWIAVRSQREELFAVIAALKQVPAIPASADVESEAGRVARELTWQFRDARQMFEAPSNWKPVKEKLTALLADIVNQHLPRTLAALWSELYLNLTPAPWLLPERPSIDVSSKRGEQRSTLQVKGRLARYILNQSEVHVLGLGWFFTRYLTYGRFLHTCLVFDDAAHELDEAAFRDLCRLWETIVRLHRVYARPLHLIIMLNQETRATEAAQATGGSLSVLGWSPDQQDLCRTRVATEDVLPPQPVFLFEKAAS